MPEITGVETIGFETAAWVGTIAEVAEFVLVRSLARISWEERTIASAAIRRRVWGKGMILKGVKGKCKRKIF